MAKDTKKGIERKENDWIGFFKSVLIAFIITCIWALIGCNFKYLQDYVVKGEGYLGKLFPDDPFKPPYRDSTYVPRRPQMGGNNPNEGAIDQNKSKMFQKITGFSSYSAPYTMKSNPPGLWGDFTEWIANSIEFSYVKGRGFINQILNLFDLAEGSVNSSVLIWLYAPFALFLLAMTPLYGFLSTLFGEFQAPNKGWLWTIAFFFILGFDFWIAGSVAFVQTLQLLITLLLLPLLLNATNVFKIMGEHYALFTGMFGLLIIINSFRFLKLEANIVLILTYLYLLWKTWKKTQTA